MSFERKDWKDRIAEYINRRRITHEDGTSELITVERDEGTISQEGDAFNAENMNEFEERIAKALTPLDTMEEVNANTQDNQLAGANAVKELGSELSEVDGSQSLSTSILEKALTLDTGIYEFKLTGSSYSANDLPDAAYRYGNATVYVRNKTTITVVLYGIASEDVGNHAMAMNYYDGNVWSDWKIHATTDDLAKYLPLAGGALSGELFINGERVALTDMPMTVMRIDRFKEEYGADSVPCNWGMILMQGYSRPNAWEGDTYYLVVDDNGTMRSGVQLNGSISIDWWEQGKAKDYLPLTGGTLSGDITLSNAIPYNAINIENKSRKISLLLDAINDMGLWDGANDEWIIKSNPDRSVNIPHPISFAGAWMTDILSIASNGNVLKMGAQNNTYCHMYSDLPFYFNKDIFINDYPVLTQKDFTVSGDEIIFEWL